MDYMWNFLDDPYVDGLILVGGTLKSKRQVSIRINELPFTLVEELEKRVQETECETEILEVPNALTHSVDLRMKIFSSDPLFGELPRYGERRFDIHEAPKEFIHGYLQGASRIKLKEMNAHAKLRKNDWISIHSPLPTYEQEALLSRKNIEETTILFDVLHIKDEEFKGKEPFDSFHRLHRKEFELAMKNTPTKEAQLKKLTREIMGSHGKGFYNPNEPQAGGGRY